MKIKIAHDYQKYTNINPIGETFLSEIWKETSPTTPLFLHQTRGHKSTESTVMEFNICEGAFESIRAGCLKFVQLSAFVPFLEDAPPLQRIRWVNGAATWHPPIPHISCSSFSTLEDEEKYFCIDLKNLWKMCKQRRSLFHFLCSPLR